MRFPPKTGFSDAYKKQINPSHKALLMRFYCSEVVADIRRMSISETNETEPVRHRRTGADPRDVTQQVAIARLLMR